jgi:signal transduction histidine kinase
VLSGSRRLSRDERATLQILALQAAVAVENARLLEAERERAALQAALRVAQADVAERRRQLRETLARQEVEHDHLAHQLHEEAAQTLAGVLFSLAALERELESAQAGPRLRELRTDIDATLQSLRTLAVSLRPPSLALGLQAALVQLLEDHAGHAVENVAIDLDQLTAPDPEIETTVYRIVQEILAAAGRARSLAVHAHRDQLTIAIDGIPDAVAPGGLQLPRARIELAGGTLSAARHHLWARIPIPAS